MVMSHKEIALKFIELENRYKHLTKLVQAYKRKSFKKMDLAEKYVKEKKAIRIEQASLFRALNKTPWIKYIYDKLGVDYGSKKLHSIVIYTENKYREKED